ncbi:MAG: DUF1926 domain-containing protein [Nitrospirae bacterium]|nr:DUF1926 domain-containing protein [Nitrospirota bacterium]
MNKLCLILALHNHQPVGNFDYVVEDAYQKSYLPFLKILERHPGIKLSLHYSGNLLLWLKDKHGDFFDLLKNLIKQGRIEMLSGGFYEPIIPAIPDDDKTGQIKKLNEFIEKELGYAPKGMWLTERVWEPAMPRHIAKAGIDYFPVDDHHFKLTGLTDKDLHGYFLTEDEDYAVHVFPGNEQLRYLIPFKDVDEVITYLRSVFENPSSITHHSSLVCMADDGEKFGVWPDTFKHVYTNGWLERFFSALDKNSDWLQTTTFAEYISKNPPAGRIYLPTASYREMGEWALFPPAAEEYDDTLKLLKNLIGDKKAHTLLRGGFWRNFLSKYPESNHLHKRMYQISRKVHKAVKELRVESEKLKKQNPKSQKTHQASRITHHDLLDELWQGQCNDAYWHGIFGGLYLPHLRSSLYAHLLRAEALSEQALALTPYHEADDLDKDGYKDIFLSTKTLSLFFTQKGGALCELSYKEKAVNVMDTLSRRYEAYHRKLSKCGDVHEHSETATIHERLVLKEHDIAKHLVFDPYRKASLIDHFIAKDTSIDQFRGNSYRESGNFIEALYAMKSGEKKNSLETEFSAAGEVNCAQEARPLPVMINKKISVRKASPEIAVLYEINPCAETKSEISDIRSRLSRNSSFCIEFNLSFLGSPEPEVKALSKGKTSGWGITSVTEAKKISMLNVTYGYLGISAIFEFNSPVNLWQFPVETVSSSEEGIERVYQGTTFIIFPDSEFISGEENQFGFVITLKGT